MTEKQKRTYRLTDETISHLEELAETWNCTATDAVTRAIRESHERGVSAIREPDASHTQETGEASESLRREVEHYAREVERLNQQIDVKDGQIADLAANLKAAQALHAAERMPKAIEAGGDGAGSPDIDNETISEPERTRPTRWEFFKAVFTGELGA